jgi:hypothetical protein
VVESGLLRAMENSSRADCFFLDTYSNGTYKGRPLDGAPFAGGIDRRRNGSP